MLTISGEKWAHRVPKSAAKKIADRRRDLGGVRLQREVPGIEEAHDCAGNIPLKGFRAGRQKERVVFPHTARNRGLWSRKYFWKLG